MDCQQFSNWLENRDIHDVSEADNALRHAQTCKECQAKLRYDEELDKLIHNALAKEQMPSSLSGRVDLSLDGMSAGRSRMSYRWFGAFSAVVAVMLVFAISLVFSPSLPTINDIGHHAIIDHTKHDDSILVVRDLDNIYQLGDLTLTREEIKAELPQGSTFVGARICPLGECLAIHMVLRQNDRRISVYLIRENDMDFSLSPHGRYTLKEGSQIVQFWKKGKYVFAMIG
ncbi:MAG: DUF3379 family protein [Desulfocapsaceae bacterium]|nr:DUF3379 family protein [Desulfocapsaceae bacterium]